MKIWIIYDSRFGNNKQVAEAIGERLQQDNDVQVHHAKDVSAKQAIQDMPDILIFGGPIHAGMISFTAKTWVASFSRSLRRKGMMLKKVAAWGTHAANPPELKGRFSWSSEEEKWKKLMDGVPAEKEMSGIQGLVVTGMPGPLEDGWQDKVAAFADAINAL
jgi:flavodoxin